MESILQQLKNAGSISVYQDFRAGHSTDLASTKNGTLTAIQFSKGANFDGATSGISIGNLGNVRAIFFLVKPNNLTGNILELINNSVYVTYAAGVLATTGFTSSTIYVNGIAGTAISSDKSYLVCITDSANIAATTTNLGEANGAFFNGNIGCFLALSVMPTATQISQITAELQNTVWPSKPYSKLSLTNSGLQIAGVDLDGALKTDFGAIQSITAEGSVIGQYISNLPFQCAETTGRWQVATSTINGVLVKTIKNTTNGRLYLDMSKFGNTTEAAYGSWEFWIKKIDAAAFSMNLMNTISTFDTAGNNGYALQFSDTEAMQFLKVANGVTSQLMAKNAAITADTWFKVKLTRTSAGSWSLYFNDILVGDLGVGTNPVTENTYTTAQYLVFECFTVANIEIALADVGGNYSFNKTYFA